MRTVLVVLAAAGCGGSPTPLPEEPKGWTDHVTEAEAHEAKAEEHMRVAEQAENAPANFACGDPVLNDQLTSGTERITTWNPCWDIQLGTEVRHRRAAERELAEAREDLQRAERLAQAQRASCQDLSEAELDSSPFANREAIAEVIPYERGDVRGARVIFEPAPGRTVARMQRLIACHQARFETLGQPGDYLAMDPTVVADARVQVRELEGGRIEVFVASDDPEDRLIITGRARELTGTQTAER